MKQVHDLPLALREKLSDILVQAPAAQLLLEGYCLGREIPLDKLQIALERVTLRTLEAPKLPDQASAVELAAANGHARA